jgi:hypothetical protein
LSLESFVVFLVLSSNSVFERLTLGGNLFEVHSHIFGSGGSEREFGEFLDLERPLNVVGSLDKGIPRVYKQT